VLHVKQILFGAIDLRALALAGVGIGVPAALAFFLSVRRLKGAFATS
jgi:hypothetical protein